MAKAAFVIAAAQSGSGKTTIAMGLMTALKKLGYSVQPYKIGPDYIDPMYHTAATGRASRNLDSFLLTEETIAYLFDKNCRDSDIAVVEGVMGLYDGIGANSLRGSTAHIAQILDLPVLLTVNANGMSLSAAALVKGFQKFSKETRISGVILNRVKSDGTFTLMKEIIEENCGIPVLGYLPENLDFVLENRHLGLYCSEEIEGLGLKRKAIADALIEHLDIKKLLSIGSYQNKEVKPPLLPAPLSTPVSIGYAKDKAFNFYYRDSLELFEALGAELIPFSPLADRRLPDADGILLGGGYPELYLRELAANQDFREDLKAKLDNGLPCFAECGGLIYLGRSMSNEKKSFELCGFFPFDFVMTKRLQHFGYMTAEIAPGTVLSGCDGATLRGHEFHYTKRCDIEAFDYSYRITKNRRRSTVKWEDGFAKGNTLAGYPHFHFYANPHCVKNFLEKAAEYQRNRM